MNLLGAVVVDRAGDPLEADEQIADRAHAVAVADAADELRGDERVDDEMLRREPARLSCQFSST